MYLLNCSDSSSQCEHERIRSFPTIRFYAFADHFSRHVLRYLLSGIRWYKMVEELTPDSFNRWIDDLRRPSIVWLDNINDYLQHQDDYNITAFVIAREKAFNGFCFFNYN